jgi:hypothetical protein
MTDSLTKTYMLHAEITWEHILSSVDLWREPELSRYTDEEKVELMESILDDYVSYIEQDQDDDIWEAVERILSLENEEPEEDE